MTYEISRTSDFFNTNNNKPCTNAYQKTPTSNKWQWFIDINNIEQLQELINEVGRIIINKTSIEIYDDYRE